MELYKFKYLKYKNKYNDLKRKSMIGGSAQKVPVSVLIRQSEHPDDHNTFYTQKQYNQFKNDLANKLARILYARLLSNDFETNLLTMATLETDDSKFSFYGVAGINELEYKNNDVKITDRLNTYVSGTLSVEHKGMLYSVELKVISDSDRKKVIKGMVKANITPFDDIKKDLPFYYIEGDRGTDRIYGTSDFFSGKSIMKYYNEILDLLLFYSLETALLSIQDKIRGKEVSTVTVKSLNK